MRNDLTRFFRAYRDGLRKHLRSGPGLDRARTLGRQALASGFETLELARIHAEILSAETAENGRGRTINRVIKEAASFFAEAITPLEQTHRGAREAALHLGSLQQSLSQRTAELAASDRDLKNEISRREAMETALKKSERHYNNLLGESERLQEELRHLSRQILSAQEEERKKISRELHDQVAAALSAIQVELAALTRQTKGNDKEVQQKIANTQKLVQDSVEIIHQFARDLRPTTLDDLGLIPALHSFTKSFSKQAGIPVRLTVFAAVEELDNDRRTALYRVAQEALTNIAKHARASRVEITIGKLPKGVHLRIKDDGRAFDVERILRHGQNKRLGILGMRERVEMVGGSFKIESISGEGTTVSATIPDKARSVERRGKRRDHHSKS